MSKIKTTSRNGNKIKKNEQAQRDELYKRRQYSDAELAQAKALGEEIIDIVDIMDNHSESVAENVETATEPLIGIIPFAVLLGSAFLNAKFVHQRNYTKINNTRTNLLKDEKVINLWNKITESLNNKNAYNYKNPRQLTNKRFVKKIPDASLRREAEEILKKFTKETAKFNRAIKIGWIAVGAAYLASFIGANIYASKLQVDSSKIARYQARKSLEDAKNFVIYTPEQIQQAKEELAKHPERKKEKLKEKLKTGMFKSIINIIKDRKAYKNSIKNDTDESKKVIRELSSEELIQAKKDKDVIQRTVRLINNEAEKYSQNMEVAAGVLINGTPFLGAAIGGILSALLNKAGILTKFVDKKVSQNTSDETKKLYQSLKKGKESGATYSFKWNKFANSYMNDMENLEYKNGIHNTRKAISISDKAKQMFTVAMAHKKGRHWLISGISAFITGIAGLLIGLKLQKSSARAGRYNAKRELEKDPSNFIGYTEDDYNEVKDVKYTGKDKSKIKEVITFIPTVLKHYAAYDKYKKHEYKEKQLLREELKKLDVSEKQLKDAQNLQRKIFNTFEKVDDNSQLYSESMEAAIDIAQPFVMYGGILTMLSPFIYLFIQFKRGKLSGVKIFNKVMNFLSKHSDKMQSEWFKNYLKDVQKNIPIQVQKTNVDAKPIGAILNEVNFKEDPVYKIITKMFKNLKDGTTNIRNTDIYKQDRILSDMKESLTQLSIVSGNVKFDKLQKLLDCIKYNIRTPQERADIADIFLNPQNVKNMGKERFKKAINTIENIICEFDKESYLAIDSRKLSSSSGDKIYKLFEEIDFLNQKILNTDYINNNPLLKDLAKELTIKADENTIRLLQSYNIEVPKDGNITGETLLKIFKKESDKFKEMRIQDFTKNMPTEQLSPKILLSKFKASIETAEDFNFRGIDKKTILETIPKLEKIIDKIPQDEIKQIRNKVIDEFNAHPDEFIKLLSSGKIGNLFKTKKLVNILRTLGISWAVFTLMITYAIESWLAQIQLKAGRLGIMKAMESLDDDKYYANIEPTEPRSVQQEPGNLLSKYKT